MSIFTPPLTVALLTYNRKHYLKEAVEAILGQTYTNFELLILDNCSTDGTAEYVLSLKDPRIRYIKNAKNNSTVEFNCISAFHIAIGHRVIVTHDDDIMERDMLEQQMDFLDKNPDVRLVWTCVSDINEHGESIEPKKSEKGNRIFPPGEYIQTFLKERLWPMPSGMMLVKKNIPPQYSIKNYLNSNKKEKTKSVAGIADVILPIRVNKQHAIGYIKTPLLKRRIHTNQFTHTSSLSLPGIPLYQRLGRITKSTKNNPLVFNTFADRFKIQEEITTNQSSNISKTKLHKIEKIANQINAHLNNSPDIFLAGIHVFLLDFFLKNKKTPSKIQELDASKHDTATQKLLIWAQKNSTNKNHDIFENIKHRRIFIFGSAFIAALLILEAKNKKHTILGCIDSNTNRQNTKLLGINIYPPDWMATNINPSDIIIISSERDHEHDIEAVIKNTLPKGANIISWKNMLD